MRWCRELVCWLVISPLQLVASPSKVISEEFRLFSCRFRATGSTSVIIFLYTEVLVLRWWELGSGGPLRSLKRGLRVNLLHSIEVGGWKRCLCWRKVWHPWWLPSTKPHLLCAPVREFEILMRWKLHWTRDCAPSVRECPLAFRLLRGSPNSSRPRPLLCARMWSARSRLDQEHRQRAREPPSRRGKWVQEDGRVWSFVCWREWHVLYLWRTSPGSLRYWEELITRFKASHFSDEEKQAGGLFAIAGVLLYVYELA